MRDGTRLIFWIDIAIVLVVAFLVIMQQWDWVVALFIGLVVLNYFDRWRSGREL